MPLQAIIFDMDGVITDTEYLDFQIQSSFVIQEGGTRDRQKLFALMGKSYARLYETMRALIGTDEPLDSLQYRYAEYVGDRYERTDYTQYFRKDIISILDYADTNAIKLAVASSSTAAHIGDILGQCGIADRFHCITSGEDMPESKPDPAIYLHTLQELGVSADAAVAIEDSPSGIMSAKGAGLRVVAYVEERMKVDQSGADYYGRDMAEILGIIRELALE